MFVARITLILPSGAGENTSCCSSCGTCECSGMTRRASYCAAGKFSRTFMHSLISSQPGEEHEHGTLSPLGELSFRDLRGHLGGESDDELLALAFIRDTPTLASFTALSAALSSAHLAGAARRL